MAPGSPRRGPPARGSTRRAVREAGPLASKAVVLLTLVVLAAAVVPATAAAADSRTGGSVVVAEGETTGDLETFGGDVVIRGTVDGDLNAFAGNVRIMGNVTGDVEVAGGNVVVAGSVGGDATLTGGNVELLQTGSIGGTLEASAGTVRIDGSVGENARVGAGEISVGETASIGGDLEYDGELTVADGASIAGETIRNPDLAIDGPLPAIPGIAFSVYFFLVNLVVGALLLLAFPGFSRGLVDRTVDRPGRTGLAGLGALVATPIVLGLVAITIVGIPVSLAGLFVYLLALWIGSIYGRYLLGAWLLSLADYRNRWAALLVGLVVVAVVGRLPIVGGLLDLGVLLWGLGALVMGLLVAYRRSRGSAGGSTESGEPGEVSGPGETAGGEPSSAT